MMPFDLPSLGWDDEFAATYARFDRTDQCPARVTRVDRGVCTVLTAAGSARASLAGAMLTAAGRDPVALPCAGDWVVVRTWPDECQTIETVLPRRTAIVRAAPDVETVAVSARTGRGLDAIRPLVVKGRTLGLLGSSGAGKSSLVNALAGAIVMTTQALRADGRGRHTTPYRALVPLPDGGAVLDTPGVRGVGLFDAAAGLDRAFADVTAFAERCRFADCAHRREPGCAVLGAVEEGRLSGRRLESW